VAEEVENAFDDVRRRFLHVIVDEFGVAEEKITDQSNFIYDLGLDSLDLAQLQLEMEQEFKIDVTDADMKDVTTVGKALLFLRNALEKK
jgi:acyl carrier protein